MCKNLLNLGIFVHEPSSVDVYNDFDLFFDKMEPLMEIHVDVSGILGHIYKILLFVFSAVSSDVGCKTSEKCSYKQKKIVTFHIGIIKC